MNKMGITKDVLQALNVAALGAFFLFGFLAVGGWLPEFFDALKELWQTVV